MKVKALFHLLLIKASFAHTWKGFRSESEENAQTQYIRGKGQTKTTVINDNRKLRKEKKSQGEKIKVDHRLSVEDQNKGEIDRDAQVIDYYKDEDDDEIDNEDEYEQWFVEYQTNEDKEEIEKVAVRVIKDYGNNDDKKIMVIKINNSDLQQFLRNEIITSAYQDFHIEATGSFQRRVLEENNNRILADQTTWGIKMIQADQLDIGPDPVKLCIIDTGYAIHHPDLPSDVSGDNAINYNGEIWDWKIDFNGHGTHIAGIIAALGKNNIGVVGVGEIPLHITRGLDDRQSGNESDAIDAIKQCIAAGAKVINMSLGSRRMSEVAADLYTKAVNEDGVIIVAAAGNGGRREYLYPASHPDVISVAAVYGWENYWEYSNYGDQVELAAPGHDILSTTTTFTAVHTYDFSYTAVQLAGSRSREQRGNLVDCGSGNTVCREAGNQREGGICLMYRDHMHIRHMVHNCVSGKGQGVIIFDASPNTDSSTLSVRINIPVVVVSNTVGKALLDLLRSGKSNQVSIGFHESDQPEHTYALFEGTSMAVPHVAAAAALLWSHFPECNNHEIRYALDVSALDKGNDGCDESYGYGIVKVKDAYDWLSNNPCGTGSWGKPGHGGGCRIV